MKSNRIWIGTILVAILDGCSDAPVAPPVRSAVHGTIEDYYGRPRAGVVVIVDDKPRVTSDAAGTFRVDGVNPTYDVALLPDTMSAYCYAGLTRRDPWFQINPQAGGASSLGSGNATITGRVPVAAGRTTMVFFASKTEVTIPGGGQFPTPYGATTSPYDGTFGFTVFWYGLQTTVQGSLVVLRWTAAANGLPAQYDAFASRDVELASGSALHEDFVQADLADPPEAEISGAVAVPADYELSSLTTEIETTQGSFYFTALLGDSVTGRGFDFTVPNLHGARFELEAFAYRGGHHVFLTRHDIAPPATGILLSIPAAPQLVTPARDATNVDDSTVFQWTPGGGAGIYALVIQRGVGGPFVALFTTETSARIPNLPPDGFRLRPGAPHLWYVYNYFPFASLDERVTRGDPASAETGDAHSETFGFTARP